MSEQGDKPSSYDNLTPLETFYLLGAKSPIPDITERTLGLTSGLLLKSEGALRRSLGGIVLDVFTTAPNFARKLTADVKYAFSDELPDQSDLKNQQLDAIYAGIEATWQVYAANSSGLILNIKQLNYTDDVKTLDKIITSPDFAALDTIPDIPEDHPHFKRFIERTAQEYGPKEETTTKRFHQGAKIGFWILKSFWYKLDPIKHPPGRD